MLSRSAALALSLTSLSTGILLGIVLARGGPAVSAQVAPASRTDRTAADAAPSAAAVRAPGLQKDKDDALYEGLARQYEHFQQIDRTFALVAQTVSPTVVHIVAQK